MTLAASGVKDLLWMRDTIYLVGMLLPGRYQRVPTYERWAAGCRACSHTHPFLLSPRCLPHLSFSHPCVVMWSRQAPNIPSISSESSSAVSDRGEYADNATTGHVYVACTAHPSGIHSTCRCTRLSLEGGGLWGEEGKVTVVPHSSCCPAVCVCILLCAVAVRSGYDVFHPDSGSPAEWAWGGIDVPAGQGILTRAYISGGSVPCP